MNLCGGCIGHIQQGCARCGTNAYCPVRRTNHERFSVACELHRDWRNDIEGLGNILPTFIPNYRNIMNSYLAQQKLKK
jgi:hypothetical protein